LEFFGGDFKIARTVRGRVFCFTYESGRKIARTVRGKKFGFHVRMGGVIEWRRDLNEKNERARSGGGIACDVPDGAGAPSKAEAFSHHSFVIVVSLCGFPILSPLFSLAGLLLDFRGKSKSN
jgi:hypothetical protein